MRNVRAMGGKPDAQYSQAMGAVSEAISLLQECGGGIDLVNAMMTKAMLMYKDPSASGDPRPRLETIKNVICEAETEAERLFTTACTGTLSPLSTSLPVARLLAAVKNARAGCLLEIANAEKALTLALYSVSDAITLRAVVKDKSATIKTNTYLHIFCCNTL